MATYRIENTIVKTENAIKSWEEETDWDGHNQISRATGSQWEHQTLYCSRRGRYWIEHVIQWQGSRPHAEWVSPQEAARWLLVQEYTLPTDLQQYADEIEE